MSSVVRFSRQSHRPGPEEPEPAIIDSHHFRSVYQPIVSPTHQKLVGYEALTRVIHNQQSVSPVDLFKAASDRGQLAELDRHLLSLHLDSFSAALSPVWLFLNIEPHTCVTDDSPLDHLIGLCRKNGLAPDRVVLELVETATDDPGRLMEFIHRARSYGFQIAIDDFGQGDSNFERLWLINPMIVKLDRTLLVNAEKNSRARLLLESLVRMIRESGSLVLLEGIENGTQARIALDTEADLLQGFLFAHPGHIEQDSRSKAERRLQAVVTDSREWSLQDSQDQGDYLKLLRYEILDACHEMMRGLPFRQVCQRLLQINGVKRCFLLDHNGVQQGNLAHTPTGDQTGRFNPLYQSAGASWAHREYFRNALERPNHVNSSRPYVALPDARRTITLSTGLRIPDGQHVLCVDIHPDEVFAGKMVFPTTL
ncbi:EAL domain-containing protein [Marinobacter salinexigens]|uniref:EAL domain-containing protein n=1 Tax=Marinobacter salinexigens TaxID=2919747 RepID=A0A5B0VJN1_9GAMM|nr:EAL domain-containing protein [Marinobacter salinexigens]KAA1174141.1 EAL domain-containing protein [Marinobacter salinexigens]